MAVRLVLTQEVGVRIPLCFFISFRTFYKYYILVNKKEGSINKDTIK